MNLRGRPVAEPEQPGRVAGEARARVRIFESDDAS